jgi:hypothetical protein
MVASSVAIVNLRADRYETSVRHITVNRNNSTYGKAAARSGNLAQPPSVGQSTDKSGLATPVMQGAIWARK